MNGRLGTLPSSLPSDAAVMAGVDARLMTRNAAQPSGALLLRAWVEGESPHGLRVRVIRIHPSGKTSTTSAGTVEMTCDIVESWLNELLGAGTTPQPPPVTRS
jgi:hypothetical protein